MRVFLCTWMLVASVFTLTAQVAFDQRVKEIRHEVIQIAKEEKQILQKEVETINKRVENREISVEEGARQKQDRTEVCADKVEQRVAPLMQELQELIKKDIENPSGNEEATDSNGAAEVMAEVKSEVAKIKTKKKAPRDEARTTSQFVFGFGLNTILINQKLSSINDNGMNIGSARFYEWGATWKTRLIKNSTFLNLKYGVSLMYNNLRPNDNNYFAKNGDQTTLGLYPSALTNEPYFRRVHAVVPVHLEMDFSKKKVYNDQTYIRSQRGFRLGVGGYAGMNIQTKQIIEYKEDGLKHELTSRGNYNTNVFVYGLSAYVGYKSTSLYAKYDLNTLFKNSPDDFNNISMGIRFDFN
ncbi:MAG: hypothetical protein J5I52_03230 [Saprospiraceae bacterium]|nr:hypothetical protein [Saprospiraceae bacterium]